jgi:hypothetical protein
MLTLFEHLPNEILLDVFEFIDTGDLYRGFWSLNTRFDDILLSLKNLSLIMEKNDRSLVAVFASRIARLEVNTWHEIDLSRFSSLQSLTIRRTTRIQVQQIRPNIIPNLVYLSLSLAFDFWSSAQLAQDVFSNGFPSLRHADLGRVDIPFIRSWSISPHLKSVGVCSSDPIIVPLILSSCPCLHSLLVQIFGDNHRIDLPSLRLNHPLQRFTFADSYGVLSLNDINLILTYIPNVECIHLTLYEMSFTRLAHTLIQRLHRLNRFDCYINELPDPNEYINNIEMIRKIHPCFGRIQCYEKIYGVRHFTNK